MPTTAKAGERLLDVTHQVQPAGNCRGYGARLNRGAQGRGIPPHAPAVLSQKMDEVRSEAEFEKFLNEQDQQKAPE